MLTQASISGNLDIVQYLVDHGANTEPRMTMEEYEGLNALDMAREMNHPHVVEYLESVME